MVADDRKHSKDAEPADPMLRTTAVFGARGETQGKRAQMNRAYPVVTDTRYPAKPVLRCHQKAPGSICSPIPRGSMSFRVERDNLIWPGRARTDELVDA